jgi:hypothetical protein
MALTLGAELVEVGLGAAHCSQAVLVLATAHQAAGLAADTSCGRHPGAPPPAACDGATTSISRKTNGVNEGQRGTAIEAAQPAVAR